MGYFAANLFQSKVFASHHFAPDLAGSYGRVAKFRRVIRASVSYVEYGRIAQFRRVIRASVSYVEYGRIAQFRRVIRAGQVQAEWAASLDSPTDPATPVFLGDRVKLNCYAGFNQLVAKNTDYTIAHNLGSKYVRVDVFFRETELATDEYSVEPQWAQSGAAGGYFLWLDEDGDGDPTLSAAAGCWVQIVDENTIHVLTGEDGVYVGAYGAVYESGYYLVIVTPMGS